MLSLDLLSSFKQYTTEKNPKAAPNGQSASLVSERDLKGKRMVAGSRKRAASAHDANEEDARPATRSKRAPLPCIDLTSRLHRHKHVFSAHLSAQPSHIPYWEPGTLRPQPTLPERHPSDPPPEASETHDHVVTGDAASDRASDEKEEAFTFFTFPAEIRNLIYEHALHYPSCLNLYSTYYRRLSHANILQRRPEITFRTPTLLLLNRRITAECLPFLRSRTLIIDRLPPFCTLPKQRVGGFMKVTDFIGRGTLQNLQHIDLRLSLGEGPLCSSWIWEQVLDEILDVLLERNVFATMRLLIRRYGHTRGTRYMWQSEWKRYRYITEKRIPTFIQTNPNVFKPRNVTVETWDIDGPKARFWSKTLNGNPYPLSRPKRMYPDPELFPSSILQFVGAGLPPLFSGLNTREYQGQTYTQLRDDVEIEGLPPLPDVEIPQDPAQVGQEGTV